MSQVKNNQSILRPVPVYDIAKSLFSIKKYALACCFMWAISSSSNTLSVRIPFDELYAVDVMEKPADSISWRNFSEDDLDNEIIESNFETPYRISFDSNIVGDETIGVKSTEVNESFFNAVLSFSVQQIPRDDLQFDRPKILKRDSLINDVNLLEQVLTEMHPGLYRYNSHADIASLFDSFRKNLPGNISESEFMKRLAQLVTKIKCGHTYLNPWNMDIELRNRLYGNKQYFPVGFKIVDGRFFVTENATDFEHLERGAELLSINEVPVDEIYNNLTTIAKSDGNNKNPTAHYLSLNRYDTSYWNAFDIYFPLFYPLQDPMYSISYRNPDEEQVKYLNVEAMYKKERAEKMERVYGSEVLETSKWKLEILNADLAIMKLGTFATWNWKGFDHKEWYTSAFAQLDSLNISNLIIDIRGNGGGLTEPKNELISYLIDDELVCDDQGKVFIKTTKLNPELLPYMETWAKPLVEGLPTDKYLKVNAGLFQYMEPSECVNISPKDEKYKGKVYVFGDSSNVSATFTFLDQAKTKGFATYVGQHSGGNKQGINGGEYVFFKMPYSKIEVDIPLKYFAPNNPRKDEGLSPMYFINTTQADIAADRDPYLEFVKSKL